MVASTIFDELVDFIATKSPKEVISFRASTKSSQRYEFLINKEKGEGLNKIERAELDNFEVIEHIMRRAKIKARLILAV